MNPRPRDPRLDPSKAEAIAAARQAWDERQRLGNGNRKVFATFDDLLDAFASDCMSFTLIASGLDVSRERVRQVYRDHFAPLFGYATGRKRQKICTVVRRAETLARMVPLGAAGVVASRAASRGLCVQAVPVWSRARGYPFIINASFRLLMINGVTVYARTSIRPKRTSRGAVVRYFRFPHRNRKTPRCAFVVLYCGAPLDACFVMPRNVYVDRMTDYLPERPNTYEKNAHLGQTDWIWQYKEAWHLLKEAP